MSPPRVAGHHSRHTDPPVSVGNVPLAVAQASQSQVKAGRLRSESRNDVLAELERITQEMCRLGVQINALSAKYSAAGSEYDRLRKSIEPTYQPCYGSITSTKASPKVVAPPLLLSANPGRTAIFALKHVLLMNSLSKDI